MVEDCLRRFILLCLSKPPFVMQWIFKDVDNDGCFIIMKQTRKNKHKHKSMLMYSRVVSRHHDVFFVMDFYFQSIEEAIDFFTANMLDKPLMFVHNCVYKRKSNRREFESLTQTMTDYMTRLH